jgi:thymidylate synthase
MTTFVSERYVEADNLSEGWLAAALALHRAPGNKLVHLIVRIAAPEVEITEIRAAAEALIAAENSGREEKEEMPVVETTRNTIFPAAWARRNSEPAELGEYYRERYTKDGLRGFGPNTGGTYFGRIVRYPRDEDEKKFDDQLATTVEKLRTELGISASISSRYEISIYNEQQDKKMRMGFPCLAHVSLHLHEGKLTMQAIYRNEYIVARGYGNFLGLAELQAYIATAIGVGVGELMMTIGHGEMDANKGPAEEALGELWQTLEANDKGVQTT